MLTLRSTTEFNIAENSYNLPVNYKTKDYVLEGARLKSSLGTKTFTYKKELVKFAFEFYGEFDGARFRSTAEIFDNWVLFRTSEAVLKNRSSIERVYYYALHREEYEEEGQYLGIVSTALKCLFITTRLTSGGINNDFIIGVSLREFIKEAPSKSVEDFLALIDKELYLKNAAKYFFKTSNSRIVPSDRTSNSSSPVVGRTFYIGIEEINELERMSGHYIARTPSDFPWSQGGLTRIPVRFIAMNDVVAVYSYKYHAQINSFVDLHLDKKASFMRIPILTGVSVIDLQIQFDTALNLLRNDDNFCYANHLGPIEDVTRARFLSTSVLGSNYLRNASEELIPDNLEQKPKYILSDMNDGSEVGHFYCYRSTYYINILAEQLGEDWVEDYDWEAYPHVCIVTRDKAVLEVLKFIANCYCSSSEEARIAQQIAVATIWNHFKIKF